MGLTCHLRCLGGESLALASLALLTLTGGNRLRITRISEAGAPFLIAGFALNTKKEGLGRISVCEIFLREDLNAFLMNLS